MLLWLLVLARLVWARPASCRDLCETAFVEKVAVKIRAGCDINAVSEDGDFSCGSRATTVI